MAVTVTTRLIDRLVIAPNVNATADWVRVIDRLQAANIVAVAAITVLCMFFATTPPNVAVWATDVLPIERTVEALMVTMPAVTLKVKTTRERALPTNALAVATILRAICRATEAMNELLIAEDDLLVNLKLLPAKVDRLAFMTRVTALPTVPEKIAVEADWICCICLVTAAPILSMEAPRLWVI